MFVQIVLRGRVGVGNAITPRRRRLSCEQADRPRLRRRDNVPAEVSELLVDALESHGVSVSVVGVCSCGWVCERAWAVRAGQSVW
jgi:hypothetical protein